MVVYFPKFIFIEKSCVDPKVFSFKILREIVSTSYMVLLYYGEKSRLSLEFRDASLNALFLHIIQYKLVCHLYFFKI